MFVAVVASLLLTPPQRLSAHGDDDLVFSDPSAQVEDTFLRVRVVITSHQAESRDATAAWVLTPHGSTNPWDTRVHESRWQDVRLRTGQQTTLTWNENAGVPEGEYDVVAFARTVFDDGTVPAGKRVVATVAVAGSPLLRLRTPRDVSVRSINAEPASTRTTEQQPLRFAITLSADGPVDGRDLRVVLSYVALSDGANVTRLSDVIDVGATPVASVAESTSIVTIDTLTPLYSTTLAPRLQVVRADTVLDDVVDRVLTYGGQASVEPRLGVVGPVEITGVGNSAPSGEWWVEVQNASPQSRSIEVFWVIAPISTRPWEHAIAIGRPVVAQLDALSTLAVQVGSPPARQPEERLSMWVHLVGVPSDVSHSDGVAVSAETSG